MKYFLPLIMAVLSLPLGALTGDQSRDGNPQRLFRLDGTVIGGWYWKVQEPVQGISLTAVNLSSPLAPNFTVLRYGFINLTAAVEVPGPEEGWLQAGSFSAGMAPVLEPDREALWGYINPKGQYLLSPRYLEAGSFRHGMALVSERPAQWGLINPQGRYVLSPRSTPILDFCPTLAVVSQGTEFKLLSLPSGEVLASAGEKIFLVKVKDGWVAANHSPDYTWGKTGLVVWSSGGKEIYRGDTQTSATLKVQSDGTQAILVEAAHEPLMQEVLAGSLKPLQKLPGAGALELHSSGIFSLTAQEYLMPYYQKLSTSVYGPGLTPTVLPKLTGVQNAWAGVQWPRAIYTDLRFGPWGGLINLKTRKFLAPPDGLFLPAGEGAWWLKGLRGTLGLYFPENDQLYFHDYAGQDRILTQGIWYRQGILCAVAAGEAGSPISPPKSLDSLPMPAILSQPKFENGKLIEGTMAFLNETSVRLREGPSANAKVLTTLKGSERLMVLDLDPAWTKIGTWEGNWVRVKHIPGPEEVKDYDYDWGSEEAWEGAQTGWVLSPFLHWYQRGYFDGP